MKPHDNATAQADTRKSFTELLRDRVFGMFFVANALSNTGNWFQNVAAGIVVFDLTGSNTAVGAVSMVQFGATMLLTSWAGGLTDRVNRTKMLLTGQVIALTGALSLAVTVAFVGVDGLPGPWPIYAATAVIGIGSAIILPSLQAVVPALVEPADLDRAITLNSLTFNIARGVGPVLAGAVIAALGAGWAIGINAATFLPLLVVLFVIRPRGSVEPDPDATTGTVRDALLWAKERPTVVALLLATLAVGWTSDPFSTLMPSLADNLGHGDTAVGFLVGCFGGGAALTAPFSDTIRGWAGRGKVISLGLAEVALGLVVLAASPALAVALLGAAIAGSGFLLGVTSTNTELQRGIPDDFRGRIMAFWSVAFLGCRPIAAGFDGLIADALSTRASLAIAAAVALVCALAVWRVDPRGGDIEGEASCGADRPCAFPDAPLSC